MEKPTLPGNCRILDFALQYKKTCKHYLYASAVDPLTLDDVINMADAQCKALWENMKLSYTGEASFNCLFYATKGVANCEWGVKIHFFQNKFQNSLDSGYATACFP